MKTKLLIVFVLTSILICGCGAGKSNPTVTLETKNETMNFINAEALIESYEENKIRNEYYLDDSYITATSEIEEIYTTSKSVPIGGMILLVDYAEVSLENGCSFLYSLVDPESKAFVETLSVGDTVTLYGQLTEINTSFIKAEGIIDKE